MTSLTLPKRELQATLIQLEADLRRLTSTVQELSAWLSRAGELDDVARVAPAARTALPGPSMAAEPMAPGWRLREGGWTLVSPQGQRLALTTLERLFMLALFSAPNHSLARNELGSLAAGRGDAGDKSATSPRGVDVMVSRLRRKAQATGMPLPLRSVRRWGYMFTEDAAAE
ncbi:helix-turn-helix domain-containing protein [Bordetella genomosp. 8]|uniref:helix-turn-helix domain-containing protein n=1 Tax=Bordetella genomosp. 8 TaxID=1416806 RepID=UPI0012FD6E0F|nr:helix-turn-helix domain-containing protein [Bordetella genomosp. 8]